MQEYIINLSKYIIPLCMAIYTFECFFVFRYREEEDRRGCYLRQRIWMAALQFLCFMNLAVVNRDSGYLLFWACMEIYFFTIMKLTTILYEQSNQLLLNNICMLLGLGFTMISRLSGVEIIQMTDGLSKASYSISLSIKQLLIALLSYVLCLLIPLFLKKIRFLDHLAWLYCTVGILLVSIVLVLGEVTHGSKLSFSLYGITFQPSEFVKILFVFFLAAAIYEETGLKRICLTSVLAGIHVIVLVISKDLGSALIFFVAFVVMIFIATCSYRYLLVGIAGGAAASVAAYFLFAHVRVRVLAWLDPWAYIDNQGYQITQSLFAIGSGSWFGMGLGQGNPGAIPYVEADFIFSSLCEELGVLTGICTILVILSCFVMMMETAVQRKNRFYKLIVVGLGTMYIFQIFLTVGGGIKFIPLTGVTLPLISYGGSSVMTTMVMFFLVLGMQLLEESASPGLISRGEKSENNRNSEKSQKQKDRDRQRSTNIKIRGVTWFFVLLFIGMMGYLVYFTATSQEEMINNSYNSRQKLLLSRNCRGTIYSADGQILAQTLIDEEGNEVRNYPYGNLFSHVVGYSTKGKTGVEAQANYYLINSNISLMEKAANQTAGLKNPGDCVYTTLDVTLQQAARKAMGIYKGAVIVSDCNTGRILAMVSGPDFDPNEITMIWDELVEDKSSTVLLNRATHGLYPPGSTFKIVTALEYIREHPEDYEDYVFSCKGSYVYGSDSISCYHGIKHGKVDFMTSFAKSCNSSFANIGMELDRTAFRKTLDQLLFDQELPLPFSYAQSSVKADAEMPDSEMMQTAIGQGRTQMTPMHLHMICSAIANDGELMTPYILDYVQTAEGKLIKDFKEKSYGQLMTEQEAQILRELMTQVVETGTASYLSGRSYTAAGKTGSAEYNNNKGDSHAWFTGFAPAEDPQICVTVIMEGAGAGGDYAVPVAKRIFDAWFEKENHGE